MQENVDPRKKSHSKKISRSVQWRTRLTKGSAIMLRSKRDAEIWNEAVVVEVSRTHAVRFSFLFFLQETLGNKTNIIYRNVYDYVNIVMVKCFPKLFLLVDYKFMYADQMTKARTRLYASSTWIFFRLEFVHWKKVKS